MIETRTNRSSPQPSNRWEFLRDVAVFQLKLVIDNLRDLALVPISLGAALVDLFSRENEKARFSISSCSGAPTARR